MGTTCDKGNRNAFVNILNITMFLNLFAGRYIHIIDASSSLDEHIEPNGSGLSRALDKPLSSKWTVSSEWFKNIFLYIIYIAEGVKHYAGIFPKKKANQKRPVMLRTYADMVYS